MGKDESDAQKRTEKQEEEFIDRQVGFVDKFVTDTKKKQRTEDGNEEHADEISEEDQNESQSPRNEDLASQDWDLEVRMGYDELVDEGAQDELNGEGDYRKQLLLRLLSIVKFFAKIYLQIYGQKDGVLEPSSANFVALCEMLADFDPIMQEHVRQIEVQQISHTYLAQRIQNELINMLAREVRKEILKTIKESKYFSVILDCTVDANGEEQLSLIIRCVDLSAGTIKVEEFFLEYLNVDDILRSGLSSELESLLNNLELNFCDIRGQGYDYTSDTKGKYEGIQQKLLRINPRAFSTPCASYSLTLEFCDLANSCDKAALFSGGLQRIYTLFSSSTKRWDILVEYVKGFNKMDDQTIKSLDWTRWESCIESVKAVRYQASNVRDALLELAETEKDPAIRSKAESLGIHELENFEFLLSLVIWHTILVRVNVVSEILQKEDIPIDVVIQQLQELIRFLVDYKENGFLSAMDEATKLAEVMEIEPVFPEKRAIRRNRQFDENDKVHKEAGQSPLESFKLNYFIYMVEQTLTLLRCRLEQLQQYEDTFGVLHNVEKLTSIADDALSSYCDNLETSLTHNGVSDVNGRELCKELKSLKLTLPPEVNKPLEVLKYLRLRNYCFPNAWIAYRILLTIPVTITDADRSFSKLVSIKSYLRATMSEERLRGLAMIAIEYQMLEKLDDPSLISDFVDQN